MQRNLWNSLEILSVQAALMVEWRQALGNDFPAAQVFLRPTLHQAESYTCIHPVSCGCRHRVIFESEDEVSAVCDCDESGCEPILLRPADLLIHALNSEMLAGAICRAFKFDEFRIDGFEGLRSQLVGVWGARRTRVVFHVPISEGHLLKEIDRLCSAIVDPFILLTPTPRFCTSTVHQVLRRNGCAQMALAGVVALASPGVLEVVPAAKSTVDALLNDFGKHLAQGKPLELAITRVEELLNAIAKNNRTIQIDNEDAAADVARQALALVRELDTTQRLKSPSLLTVFRLYCVNEMSASMIAAQCGCSKTAVIERLQILARKTGMPAERLRRYSSQFERMEDELGDCRAKGIYRRGQVDAGSDDAEAD